MSAHSWLRNSILASTLVALTAHAVQIVPEVYQDDEVTVRAGIAEIGLQPIHMGDALSMVIQLEFDDRVLRIETLDSDFFRRVYAKQKGFKLYAPPVITKTRTAGGDAAIQAVWPFQILDCPGELENCPGDKIYTLPVISISYQLIDPAGQALNNKSVRFQPWPGQIAVSPAIASMTDAAAGITNFFPHGAYPKSRTLEQKPYAVWLAMVGGILILLMGMSSRVSGNRMHHHRGISRPAANRWERALSQLHQQSLQDEQWADLLRRCMSWYCLDELGCNPYTLLTDKPAGSVHGHQLMTDFHSFFVEVLQQHSIALKDRGEYLSRFIQMAETSFGPGALENVA
jgi:hypothetical protein